MTRTVCWFSCGAASAVATKLTLQYGWPNITIAYCDTGSEHPDNERFISECERWFGQPVVRLKSDKYISTWDVFLKTKYLVGPKGARCTTELKRKLRTKFQQPGDLQIFGFTIDEADRAERFENNFPDVDAHCPLIDAGLTKGDCLSILKNAGIELPEMYRLGYLNNNCIGCVKGGMGYWNKIRRDFPLHFAVTAQIERQLGRTVLKDTYLDQLDPSRGNYKAEPNDECSFMCDVVSNIVKE
jgi:3'-phosphoadenosine 5'-phosphosulfate sulfotransferase (PAPS reductase)/FAD synthetase